MKVNYRVTNNLISMATTLIYLMRCIWQSVVGSLKLRQIVSGNLIPSQNTSVLQWKQAVWAYYFSTYYLFLCTIYCASLCHYNLSSTQYVSRIFFWTSLFVQEKHGVKRLNRFILLSQTNKKLLVNITQTRCDNKIRELVATKTLYTLLLNITVVAFKVVS